MSPAWTHCSERFARVDVSFLHRIESKNDLAVFLALCSRADGENRDAWPSKARIGKDAGIAPDEVRRSLRELEKIGAIRTRPRFNRESEQITSLYVIQDGEPGSRYAFIAAPWIARIETLNALRLFVALCSCANHEDSIVRGHSRSGLAKMVGFHESAVTKALPHLLQIGAVSATISTTGRKTTYRIEPPPEAFAADGNLENRQRRLKRHADLAACVDGHRRSGTTFHFAVERGIAKIHYGGRLKPSGYAVNYDIQPFLNDLPWCMVYDAIGPGDGPRKIGKKAA